MSYEIKLAQFEGPLDLLLHLIRKNEVDIYDIPIASITEEYIDYIHAMEAWSLEIASEFLVMAATLLSIKSRMLLPRTRVTEELAEEDPRLPLVEQLLEYERCKWAATRLSEMASSRADVYSRLPMDLSPYQSRDVPALSGATLWDLVDAFRKLYLRMPVTERVAEIRGHVERVEDVMVDLALRIRKYRRIEFSMLFQSVRSRQALVTGFLAVLEMMKDGTIACEQTEPFGPLELIWIGD